MAVAVVLLCAPACSTKYTQIRKVPNSPLVERLKLASKGGPKPSSRTVEVLRRYDLEGALKDDPVRTLEKLQAQTFAEPTPAKLYAVAELSYLMGKRQSAKDEGRALHMYGASVAHAYMYLFDPRYAQQLNPYDPQFRDTCDLYNGALEECLRIVKKQGALVPGKSHLIKVCDQEWQVAVVSRGDSWRTEDFHRFEFTSEYEVSGLRNQYRSFGLGVPMIAVRKAHENEEPSEKFYPPELSFPVTAFLRLLPDDTAAPGVCKKHKAIIELYDPLMVGDLYVDRRKVPLESDLTTPLAYFLDQGKLPPLATLGLLKPDESQKLSGLYMAQPYEPSKIPVLFVHGLWSDPTTWTEMFNDLRAAPEVRQNYQFWFYFYPSGQPFWHSAAHLRGELARLRGELDPKRDTPTFDQLVLVGHSMGGLVSKLQVVDGGDEFWKTASQEPFQLIKATSDVRDDLQKTYYFQRNPSVRRVVTIGTPHRGSNFANSYTRYLARQLIAFPKRMVQSQQELYKENPDAFGDGSAVRVDTSVDSLAPGSPFLQVMLEAPKPRGVHYHNIVGVTELGDNGELPDNPTDSIVAYSSAHLDDVESELLVRADHLGVHRHALSVLEVRRILLEHMAEMRKESAPKSPYMLVQPDPKPDRIYETRPASALRELFDAPPEPE